MYCPFEMEARENEAAEWDALRKEFAAHIAHGLYLGFCEANGYDPRTADAEDAYSLYLEYTHDEDSRFYEPGYLYR